MSQPATVTIFTVGVQGPPGAGVSFAGTILITGNTTLIGSTYNAVNTTSSAITLTMPSGTDGMLIGVADVTGHAATNPITITTGQSGTTIDNPSARGTYAATVQINVNSQVVWWAYAVSVNQWLPAWW